MGLRLRDIRKRFGSVEALRGVDLDLGDREVLGLIGPNGSGKTTLINCISGVMPMDEGTIELAGRDITGLDAVKRSHAGLARTFQNLRLFNEMTVMENVAVALRGKPGDERSLPEFLDYLLTRLGLVEVEREQVHNLPYGHQRKVEIARALATRPSILLLDEPAAGLNDEETAELLELIREIVAEHDCSVLIVDHDMALISGVSDRVQVLDEGSVLYVGDPKQVFNERAVVEAYLGIEE